MPNHLALAHDVETFAGSVLRDALELLPDAIVLFDADDKLALWNSRYSEIYSRKTPLVRGMRFIDIMRNAIADGLVPDAEGRAEAWLAARMERHNRASSTYEHRLANGRWVRIQERRSAAGWSIGVRNDITDLKQREESFRLLFESSPTPMYVVERPTLRFVSVNAAALHLYGYLRERLLSMTLREIWPDRERADLDAIVADGSLYSYADRRPWTHLRDDGSEITVRLHTRSLTLDRQPVLLSSISDITEQQVAEAEAKRARAFLDSVIDLIPVGVFVKDLGDGGRYVIYNRYGEQLVGRSRDEIIGCRDHELFGAEGAATYAAQDADVMGSRELKTYTDEHAAGDGRVRIITTKKVPIVDGADGAARYLLGVSEDITDRQRMAARLDHMAHHDALTGLPNRVVLDRRIAERASAARVDEAGGDALLYVDLDGFKGVNDTLGHRVGDSLLCVVAERMRGLVTFPDLAVRLGGDEFVLMLSGASPVAASRSDVAAYAADLIELLSAPCEIEGHTVSITASVGIAFAHDAANDPETWLRNADIALYAAKRSRSGTALMFSPDLDAEAAGRRDRAADLSRGLDAGEFEIRYQPFFTADRCEGAGHEALLRWRHPVRGLLAPSEFIPIAEDLGLIVRLGAWVLRRACADAAAWPRHLRLAVNLSPVQFRDDGLLATVASALASAGLPPQRLDLEVTTAVLLADDGRNVATLHSLRRLGTRLVLDGFGSGRSSLEDLQHFRFDAIKLDRDLVRSASDDGAPRAIVRATIGFATSLGMQTTALGIETPRQREIMTAEGCGHLQGFLLGRPSRRAALAVTDGSEGGARVSSAAGY